MASTPIIIGMFARPYKTYKKNPDGLHQDICE